MAYRRSFRKRRVPATRKVSKTVKQAVKTIVNRMKPKQICHNGPSAANQILGTTVAPVANFWQNIRTLTEINSGNAEFNKTGDQIYIHGINLNMYVSTTASNDMFRCAIIRQKSSGTTPAPVNPNVCYQVVTPGFHGCISPTQDDKNYSILFDKAWTLGIAAGLQESRWIKVYLKFKNPLPVVYFDNTAAPTSVTTLLGDIALCVTSGTGSVDLYYQYSIQFSEK